MQDMDVTRGRWLRQGCGCVEENQKRRPKALEFHIHNIPSAAIVGRAHGLRGARSPALRA
jgi:hypothetical protein